MAKKTKAKSKWRFRAGARFNVKAEVVGPELEAIRKSNDGNLKPDDVVEAARDKTSPLHPAFDWNNTTAAESWRRQQARLLINSIECYVEIANSEERRPVTAFLHIGGPEQGYRESSEVMLDVEMREEALGDAMRLLKGVRRRYSELTELAAVFTEIDKVEPKIKAKKKVA